MRIVPMPDQSSDVWRNWRRTRIGASDAPIIMGESPFSTLPELIAEKTGASVPQVKTHAQLRGSNLEPWIRARFEDRTGLKFPPVCIESDQYFWMAASLDGWHAGTCTVLEIKAPNIHTHRLALAGYIPSVYRWQIVHQSIVSGSDRIIYLCYSDNQSLKEPERFAKVCYAPSAEEKKALIEREEQFFREYME